MLAPQFPLAAIVGQPQMKLALMLASVDWRLSVLLKGDKGSGKSTAARGLAGVLPHSAKFVNLPIGTTEDRLLGGLDLAHAFEGDARLKRGLIHEAHGGVLYIDEVNLLPDSLADQLLDVASSGRHYVERDGFSASADAQFVLLGSMNAEEGSLRPQLLDRFALSLDVEAPRDPEHRAQIIESRLLFDIDPVRFCAAYEEEQQRLQRAILEARAARVGYSKEALRMISHAVAEAGVHSLRADLAILRAALAHAALSQRDEIGREDIEAVLPLVFHHRTKQSPPPRPPDPPPHKSESKEAQQETMQERVFPVDARKAPEFRLSLPGAAVLRGRTAEIDGKQSLDVVASFTQSFRNSGVATLKRDQLVFKTPPAASGIRFIFVVDASGSHAAQQRMRAVKGTIAALLDSSVDVKDEVAVISFRGPRAEIVLPPCRDAEAARRVLDFLPTGGRTPLAHALELAHSLVSPSSVVVLVTDGRANVSAAGGDPLEESLLMAAKIKCPAVVVDSSLDMSPTATSLATAMRARLIRLDDMSREALLSVLPS